MKAIRYPYVIISVRDDASANLSSETNDILSDMGLKETLMGSFRASYIAITKENKICVERMSTERKIAEEYESNNISIAVTSGGYGIGCTSSILINGKEYSQNYRGINIVLYDAENNEIVDSVAFDTSGNGQAIRNVKIPVGE